MHVIHIRWIDTWNGLIPKQEHNIADLYIVYETSLHMALVCMWACMWLPVRLSWDVFDWYFLWNKLYALCLFSIKDSFSQGMTSADNDVTEIISFFIFNPCVLRSQNEIDGNIGSNPSSGCLSSDSCSFSKISQSSTEDLSGNLFNLFQRGYQKMLVII